jgi:hypothetical protein
MQYYICKANVGRSGSYISNINAEASLLEKFDVIALKQCQ